MENCEHENTSIINNRVVCDDCGQVLWEMETDDLPFNWNDVE